MAANELCFEGMAMATQQEFIKAIRDGSLAAVVRMLDEGIAPDDEGDPGMPLGFACYLGHCSIVREMARRGAGLNLPDNAVPTSPLSMAVRGKQKEMVRTLVELGVEVPAGMATGLSEQELTLARWMAVRDGHVATAEPEVAAVEEIVLAGYSGTDTVALEAEALRLLNPGR